jgi:transposase
VTDNTRTRALDAVASAHRTRLRVERHQHDRVLAAYRAGLTVREIAAALGRHQPTVSRQYAQEFARIRDEQQQASGRRPKPDRVRVAALTRLAEARTGSERAEAGERAAVLAAREAGVTWRAIGEVMGLRPANAQVRFTTSKGAARGSSRVHSTPAEQAALARAQLDRHGDRLPAVLLEAGRLRADSDLSMNRLAAQAGLPYATLQHRLDRLFAFGGGAGSGDGR